MLVNRIGDVGIAISIYLVYDTFKSLDFDIMLASSYYITEPINFFNYDFNRLNLIGIFFLIGTAGKSAQMGLHT
jgi:NADH:ubiquinone oxidoreductase subunit 5 (subunit L)/multisubunit Na+/H+ antiporter MnhA subunit